MSFQKTKANPSKWWAWQVLANALTSRLICFLTRHTISFCSYYPPSFCLNYINISVCHQTVICHVCKEIFWIYITLSISDHQNSSLNHYTVAKVAPISKFGGKRWGKRKFQDLRANIKKIHVFLLFKPFICWNCQIVLNLNKFVIFFVKGEQKYLCQMPP